MDQMIVLGSAVLLARVGQALYATGLSRSKNAAGAATRSVCDFCFSTLAFWALGAAVLFQNRNGFFGLKPGLLLGWGGADANVFFFAAVTLLATGAVGGAVAERSKFFALGGASLLLAGVLVPVAGQWAWRGWLHRMGFLDVAGASAVHLVAGVCAAAGAVAVGPRHGKYNRDGSANMIPGHNVPLAAAGVLVMLAAWVPYVVGCALSHDPAAPAGAAAVNVLLSAAGGGAAAVVFANLRYGKPDVVLALLGLLGGLVSITAAGGRVGTPAAVLIGAAAGVLVPACTVTLDLAARVDDPAGAICVHAVGGAWGTLAAGLFAPNSFADRLKLVGVQALGIVAIAALAAAVSFAVFAAIRATVGLRSKEADEFDGLDLAEHDIGAYPDFQQTMIKSYHLREA